MTLTKKKLDSLKIPTTHKARYKDYFDGDGLSIRVNKATNIKRWIVQYNFNGKRKMLMLDTYPNMLLRDAREERNKIKKMALQGIDPYIVNNNIKKKNIVNAINKLQNQLKIYNRSERRIELKEKLNNKKNLDKEQYLKNLKINGNVDPLIEIVNLEQLVGIDVYENVIEFEEKKFPINQASIRGKKINFYTPNTRSLWQSFGQEFIEPELLDFIEGIPKKGVYFDIGASTGIFALYAGFMGINTYCLEPESLNYHVLNQNRFLNYKNIGDNFHIFNLALSSTFEIQKIYMEEFKEASHQKILGNGTKQVHKSFKSKYSQNVITMTFDEFTLLTKTNPTDVKIDVDGAELMVVKGMKDTLKKSILKRIFIEISETNEESILALKIFQDHGFKIKKKVRVQNYFSLFNYVLTR